jgi:hypothetical protein
MIRILLGFFLVSLSSCFLFSDFSKRKISYSDTLPGQSIPVIIPRKFNSSANSVDSSGNEAAFFHYRNGAVLYFAKMNDTTASYQYINYDMNIPKTLYQSLYFKGVDSNGRYWRETRFGNYKAGYYGVNEDRDGVFDSSLNYFHLRSIGL